MNTDYSLRICGLIKKNIISLKSGTLNQFAEKIGLNERYLKTVLKKEVTNFRLETLIMISNYLNIHVNELISDNLVNLNKKEKENLDSHVKNIATILKRSRSARGFTQREFAKHLRISLRLYISIEKTLKDNCDQFPNLTLTTLFKIANYLKITLETLLNYREKP